QRHGFDCGSTFATVCRLESQRILLAIATAKNWPIIVLDVQTTFLNGKLKETVFCKQPPGFETTDPTTGQPHVMLLRRALYGLRQSPNVWNATIESELRKLGFTATASDPCVYTREQNDKYVMLTLFVDDILLIGPSIKLLQDVQDTLKNKYAISDLGPVSLILGMKVSRDTERGTLKLSKHKYAISLLHKFNMDSCNPLHTPGVNNSILPDTEGQLLDQQSMKQYQAMVGSLIFLSQCTKFDIAFSVTQVARYMSRPTTQQLAAVKRIFRYLKGTPDLPIVYRSSGNNLDLRGFCDSSYGNSGIEGKMISTSGTMFFLSGGSVHFSSSLQRITATSTTQAELIALARGGKSGTYLFNLLRELGWSSIRPSIIFSDSQGALHLSSNANYRNESNNLAICFFSLKDLITHGKITINYIKTTEQLADILTKFCKQSIHRRL
ncbi:unnamed protein product, partial [Sphacelaria rigidula]